ncbi:hypothetical protein V2J09_020618 [Rumex salicifolius]
MAMLLRTSASFRASSPLLSIVPSISATSSFFFVNFRNTSKSKTFCLYAQSLSPNLSQRKSRVGSSVSFASTGEATETEIEPEVQDILDANSDLETSGDEKADVDEPLTSALITSLQLYKEALQNNHEQKITEIEAFLKSIENEKIDLEKKVLSLSEEMMVEKARILRISADFDNFRKRTEKERLSLVSNARGEVLESLLPVLDNFERAKAQIKVETEGEEKVNNSYQSIYKQFVEILNSLGVVTVESVGNSFDPLLHEAIMQEESMEYVEGIIIEEYRKGFKLGDRLLRPAMVKVSAGPGPAKTEQSQEPENVNGSSQAEEQDDLE